VVAGAQLRGMTNSTSPNGGMAKGGVMVIAAGYVVAGVVVVSAKSLSRHESEWRGGRRGARSCWIRRHCYRGIPRSIISTDVAKMLA
jgi:hypothetical protein